MADTLREEAVAIPQVTWIGGVQDFLPQHMTGETASKELLNCEVTNHGTVRRRGGMREQRNHGTITSDVKLLKSATIRNYPSMLLSLFETAPGSSAIRIDDGNATISISAPFNNFTDECDIVQLLDRIYFLEPGQRPAFWAPGQNTLQHEVGAFATTMPNVGTVAYFQGRAWAGGETAKPDLLYFSNGLSDAAANEDEFTWDQTFQAFRMRAPVRGILPFRNILLFVFTTNSIEAVEMNPRTLLNSHISTLSEAIGLATKHTLRIAGEDAFFMDQFGHIRSLKQTELDESRGITNVPLSQPIKNVIDRQNKGRLSASRAVFHDGVYYVGWPRESSTVADEWWGFSIRDRAWFGPNYFQRDEQDDEHLIPTLIGGFASHEFDLGAEKAMLYVLGKTVDGACKVWDILDELVMDDDGVLIPVRITTRAYQPIPATRIGWRNLEQEFRFRHSEHDATVDVVLEGRLDEGAWQSIGTVTVAPDAAPALPENLPFFLTPYGRQRIKNVISGFDQSYSWQNRITIRDRLTRFEIVQQLVSGYVENQNYAR